MGGLVKGWAGPGARRAGLIVMVLFVVTAVAVALLAVWSHQAWPPALASVLILAPGLYLAWKMVPDVPAGQLVQGQPYPAALDAGMSLSPAVAVPRQLPGSVPEFAGRAEELERLTSLLAEAASPGGATVICAIDGTAGVGKTTLAVQGANQVTGRFPDGQLYVDLHGFDPTLKPMKSAEAIRGFLDAFKVPAARIPDSLQSQGDMYRDLFVGRRVLVVLDNARDTSQVRPLLPSQPGCAVVVTSRNRLSTLIANGARLLSWPAPTSSPSTTMAGSPSTTCSAPTPRPRRATATPSSTRARRGTGCWITTCTARRPPGG